MNKLNNYLQYCEGITINQTFKTNIKHPNKVPALIKKYVNRFLRQSSSLILINYQVNFTDNFINFTFYCKNPNQFTHGNANEFWQAIGKNKK